MCVQITFGVARWKFHPINPEVVCFALTLTRANDSSCQYNTIVFMRSLDDQWLSSYGFQWHGNLQYGISRLTHLPLDKMADVLADGNFKCIFLNENDRILIRISLKFPGVQLTIRQHWFRQWLGAEQATGHYLNQCLPGSLTHICGTRGRWVNSRIVCKSHRITSAILDKCHVIHLKCLCVSL